MRNTDVGCQDAWRLSIKHGLSGGPISENEGKQLGGDKRQTKNGNRQRQRYALRRR